MSIEVAERRVSARIGLVLSMALFSRKRVKFSFVPSCFSAELWINGTSNNVGVAVFVCGVPRVLTPNTLSYTYVCYFCQLVAVGANTP